MSTRTYTEQVAGYGVRTITETVHPDGSRTTEIIQPMLTMWRMDHDGCEQVYRSSEIHDPTTHADRQSTQRRYEAAIRALESNDGGPNRLHALLATCYSLDDSVMIQDMDGKVRFVRSGGDEDDR